MISLPGDVIVIPEQGSRWVVMNVFARTCLGVETCALELLRSAEVSTIDEILEKCAGTTFRVWNIHYFSNQEGLLADPTRYKRDPANWGEGELLTAEMLLKLLLKHSLLIEDKERYRARFAPKKNLLDAEHFGSFHQQLGQHLATTLRQPAEEWWVRQKFNDDGTAVLNNLYGAIQDKYLKKYFPRKIPPGSRVLDVGCGTGYYSELIAKSGAEVIGVDPNSEYIQQARSRKQAGVHFETAPIGTPNALSNIVKDPVDFVFMSDALLFYFSSLTPGPLPDIRILLEDIRSILKPGGTFISVEPHYIFWLLPWLGEPDHPFTVLNEYLNKSFGVTATISKLIRAFAEGGFAVTWMEELTPEEHFQKQDNRAFRFAKEYPLWQLFELVKTK